jgi:hypothetical protein
MIDTSQPDSFDSPWKEALERYLPDFMAFFFPQAEREIDWSRGYVLLDTELRQIVRDAELGVRRADRLVQVQRRSGEPTLVYIHIEVQSQYEVAFAERMFVYHYRLHDRYRQPIVSLAVLGDERPTWKPSGYHYALWDCALDFRFPVAKLLDYAPQRAQLEADANPFATVVLAHLAAQETRQSDQQRALAKFALTRRLYMLGYDRQEILDLYAFIDWMLRLPPDLEDQVWRQIEQYEQETRMSYITTAERIGHERGLEEGRAAGLLEGIVAVLEIRFGQAGVDLIPEIQRIDDVSTLERVLQAAKTLRTLDEIRAVYTTPTE